MKQKYIYISGILVIALLLVVLLWSFRATGKMEKKWKDAVENVKAYSDQFNNSEIKNRAFKLTVEQLEQSNDSIFKELNEARKELKIKDSKLKSLQYVSSDFSKVDTIHWTDTIFRDPNINIDTLLSDEWYSVRVGLKYPSMIVVKPEFKSKKYIVVSAKRETVNPPKKFFLFRWFQKKHTVVNVDVVEKNPYVQNQNNRFVEIIR